MNNILSKLKVRPDERGRALTLALFMAVISAGGAIASPGIDALFFTRFGVELLPYMYLALAGLTIATSSVVALLLSRVSEQRLHRWVPLAIALAFAAERMLLGTQQTWIYPLLWLTGYLTWTLQYLVAWGMAGSLFDTRQAKRLFPLFAAGGILGTALGGLITRPLVTLVGSENLVLAWSAALLISLLLVRPLEGDPQGDRRTRTNPPSFFRGVQRGFRLARRSELMRWISAGVLLLGLLLFAVMFPFSRAVADRFPSENEIAGFLGIFQGATTVIAFLTSLLLANRVYARIGFMGVLVAFAAIYLLGFAALATLPVFAAFAGLRFVQLAWRLGVADTAYQAVFNVLPPDARESVRAFVDGISRQIGVGLAGGLMLLNQSLQNPAVGYWLSAALSAAAVWVLWRARHAYRGALAQALRIGQPHVFTSEEQPFGGFLHDAAAVQAATDGVSDLDPAIRRVSAEILGNLPVPEAEAALVSALDDPDPGVRSALLRSLARARATPALLDVAAHLQDPEPEVRLAAAMAVRDLAGYQSGIRPFVEPLLDDPAPEVRSCAAVIILQTGSHDPAAQALRRMGEDAEPAVRVIVLQALAGWGDPMGREFAGLCLQDRAASVRRAAVEAWSRCAGPQGLEDLVPLLGDEDQSVRAAAAHELARFGDRAAPAIMQALDDPALEGGALLALRDLSHRGQSDQLEHYANSKRDQAVYYDDLWQGLIAEPIADGPLDLLADSVRSASKRQALFAVQAIGLMLDSDSVFVAVESLESEDRRQRANALEVLDSLGKRQFVAPLIAIWADAEVDGPSLMDTLTCVERALQDDDPWIRACAALAAGALEEKRFTELLTSLRSLDDDLLVRETAARSLNGGHAMEALPTLSIMERIIFLRRVPLFADLPPRELKQVAAIAGEHYFTEDELIAQQGELGDEMYIIVDGEVAVLTEHESGRPQELARRGPGEYVGEMSIISHEPRMASLRATGEVRMLCIGQKEFEGIVRERPETGLAVMRELIVRLKEAQGSQAP